MNRPDEFRTTRWTRVISARGDSPEGRLALSELCADCYAPVVVFLRAEGRDEDSARELAHEFFARVLEHQSLDGADPRRGRFRSYLLGALKHFLANHREAGNRLKRGGGVVHESLSASTDTSPGCDPPDERASATDVMFDREWAVALLARALKSLEEEWRAEGRGGEFEVMKPWLTGDLPADTSGQAALRLGLSGGAWRVAVHRLRRRLREIARAEVAATVHDPRDVAGELSHLIQALG